MLARCAPLVAALLLAGPLCERALADPSPAPASSSSSSSNADANGQTRADKRNPESPASQPSAPKQEGLLGDFGGGTRSALAKKGFTLSAHLVNEFAGNLSGGIPLGGNAEERGTAIASEFGFGFDADFGKIAPKSGAGILHVLITERFGSSLASQTLGNLVSVQEIYGDGQTTRFTYLDYEQPLLQNKLNIRFGKINQQNDFIAGSKYWGGNLYCYFQNNNICGTPAAIPTDNGVVPAGTEGYNYYPSSMWGVRVKGSPNKNFYVEAAALQANPIVNSPVGGAYFGFYGDTGTELPLELGLTLRDAKGGETGNLRVGGYFDTSNVQDYATRSTGLLTVHKNATNAAGLATIAQEYARGREGAYVQADHVLGGTSKEGGTGTALFVAAEYSDPNTAVVSSFVDAGIVRHGTFARRPADTVALGYATENFNPRLQRLETALQNAGYAVPYTSSERALELNYGLQATTWFLLRPGFQYVLNPNGQQTNVPRGFTPARNAVVFGLTSVITF